MPIGHESEILSLLSSLGDLLFSKLTGISLPKFNFSIGTFFAPLL